MGKKLRNKQEQILIIGLVLIAFSFLVLVFSGIIIFKTRVSGYKKVYEGGNVELGEDISLRAFTFKELENIINGFTEDLGRGAFGTVYKGVISQNQKVVAVKRLERGLSDGEK